jgi:hypothetical protein
LIKEKVVCSLTIPGFVYPTMLLTYEQAICAASETYNPYFVPEVNQWRTEVEGTHYFFSGFS